MIKNNKFYLDNLKTIVFLGYELNHENKCLHDPSGKKLRN